jgi:alkanesulfonate monooxygenase SsuD/methylene tetrahydromethanopterin reductase-like flavin-dependent oxidoreductase (luciferase family)
MRFGLSLPLHGQFCNPRLLVELAVDAESAGWDGFFVWDHIAWQNAGKAVPITDPWIVLAAIAAQTNRIKLGPMVTPLPRRRPWKVARETVALDYLSEGRVILGVGLGAWPKVEFRAFNEEDDSKIRGRKLDEALDILLALWSGEPVNYDGQHYHVANAQFLPRSVQEPRIPIWVAGSWRNNRKRRPFRRAASFEGTFPFIPRNEVAPQIFKEIRSYVLQYRTNDQPFDVVCGRRMDRDGIGDAQAVAEYADAGVTWWMVGATPSKLTVEQIRQYVRQGPPRS